MSYDVLLTVSTNVSIPGNDVHRVTARIRKQEDFVHI